MTKSSERIGAFVLYKSVLCTMSESVPEGVIGGDRKAP